MVRYSAKIAMFLYLLSGISAQQELNDLIDKGGAWIQWDGFRDIGIIWREDSSLAFKIGSPYLLEDFEIVHSVEALWHNDEGAIMVPSSTATVLQDIFPPRRSPLPTFEGSTQVTTIFIDPGHGGKDPGALAYHQSGDRRQPVAEKDIVLKTGQYLATLLKTRFPEKRVILSRSEDQYVSLEQRTELANNVALAQNESMIFISLHVNASLNTKAKGFEVWYLPPEVKRHDVVNPEQVQVDDPEVLSILNIIRDEELTIESVLLARSVLSSLQFHIGMHSPSRGLREESWYVVRNAKMPAILVEIGFVSNEEERKRLMDSEYLQTVALALYRGIRDFVENIEGNNE